MGKPWGILKIATERSGLIAHEAFAKYHNMLPEQEMCKIGLEAIDQIEYLQNLIAGMEVLLQEETEE